VGLASVYLPGTKNKVPHTVTSHAPAKMTSPPAPISEKRLSNLYKGTTTNVMFRQFARAFSGSNTRDITSTISKAELPEADTGCEFFKKVVFKMDQDMNEKLPVGWAYYDSRNNGWRIKFESTYYNTRWQLTHSYIDSTSNKPSPYFAVNLVLAENMGWVVATSENTYEIGPNLRLMLPGGVHAVKPNPASCNNAKFTFTTPIHVTEGLLWLCSSFTWEFVNLNEAFAKAIRHVYTPPTILHNVFRHLMQDGATWSEDAGLEGGGFVSLEISPHYWNKRTMGFTLVKNTSAQAYLARFSWAMMGITYQKDYTLCIELYMTDKTLFDKAQVSVSPYATGLWIEGVKVTKHTHEYHGTHLLYYHRVVVKFRRTNFNPPANLYVDYEVHGVASSYPIKLTDHFYVVVYGVEGLTDDVEDVYDGHPIIETRHTTKTTVMKSTRSKTTEATPVTHGDNHKRPLMLYCNLGQSVVVNNQAVNLLRMFEYADESTLIEPEHLQLHKLRGELIDVVDINVTEWNGQNVQFTQTHPSIVTLFFQKEV